MRSAAYCACHLHALNDWPISRANTQTPTDSISSATSHSIISATSKGYKESCSIALHRLIQHQMELAYNWGPDHAERLQPRTARKIIVQHYVTHIKGIQFILLNTSIAAWIKNHFRRTSKHNHIYI